MLKATIGPVQAVSLYVGAVVGSGVLLVPGLAAEIAGPASLLAWVLMSFLVVPPVLTLGLLSARYPDAGGVATFVRTAFGRSAGAVVGWFFLLSVPMGAPIVAVTAAAYVGAALPLGGAGQAGAAVVILVVVLATNLLGMRLAGGVQVLVIAAVVGVIVFTVGGALSKIEAANFIPFAPHGWPAVGQAAAVMFWCFIGWEAVTHLSEEFVDPQRDVLRSVGLSLGVVSVLYFMVALATVGTGSYGGESGSYAALAVMMRDLVGPAAGAVTGVTAFLICIAAANAYVGGAARVALALARAGAAPRFLGRVDAMRSVPVGGLCFVGTGAAVFLGLLLTGRVTVAELILFPNATFVAIYLGGSLAGIRLLRDTGWGVRTAWMSLAATAAVYVFLGRAALLPPTVVLAWGFFTFFKGRWSCLKAWFVR